MNTRYLYLESFLPELSVRYFGAVTMLNQDVENRLFPQAEEPAIGEATATPAPSATPAAETETTAEVEPTAEPVDRSAQILDIDLAARAESASISAIAALDSYFAEAEPSYKNE